MKLLIADDEALARERLMRVVTTLPDYQLVGVADTGKEALRLIIQQRPDIALLDVRMPELDGLAVARQALVLDYPPVIVFCTAYDQYALPALGLQAAGYLLKPVRQTELVQVLARAQRLNRLQLSTLSKQLMSKPAVTAQPTQYLSASQQGRLIRVAVADIWFLRAEQKYVTAYYSAGSLLLSTSLKELEKQLANYFIRIHRNTLVATGCIKRLAKDTRGHWRLYLRGLTESLPVSRRQVAAVRRYLRADHVS